jgi:hypothetical protein
MQKTRIMHIENKIRIAEWTGADWPRHVFENRQIHQLWRAHFPKPER